MIYERFNYKAHAFVFQVLYLIVRDHCSGRLYFCLENGTSPGIGRHCTCRCPCTQWCTLTWFCSNIGYLFETYFQLKSHEISIIHDFLLSSQINHFEIMHGAWLYPIPAVLCTKFQNDLATEMYVIHKYHILQQVTFYKSGRFLSNTCHNNKWPNLSN